VPFGDTHAVTRAVLDLRGDPAGRVAMGARGHLEARRHHHWPDHAPDFVRLLEEWAAIGTRIPVSGRGRALAA
jgi:hypothetical protein